MATSAIGEGQLPLMDKNGNLERTPLFDPSSHPISVANVARKYQALQKVLTLYEAQTGAGASPGCTLCAALTPKQVAAQR